MTITLRFRSSLWLGWSATIVACGLFTLLSPETTTAARVGYLMLMGCGTGILFPALASCVQASQPDEDVAIATSTFVFIRSLGQTLGVAFGGVIFQNQWDKNMAQLVSTKSIPTYFQIPGSLAESVVLQLPLFPPYIRQLAQGLYSDSLRVVWICFIPLAIIAFISSLFARNYSLNKGLNSKQSFNDTTLVTELSNV